MRSAAKGGGQGWTALLADDSKGGARKVNIGGNFAQGTFAVVVGL
jgi:hypothetical protein